MRDFGLKHTARAAGCSSTMCRCCRAVGCSLTSSTRVHEARAHRLSRDAEEHGGRRRHRHAVVSNACTSCARHFIGRATGAQQFQSGRRLPREVRRASASHRSADLRRRTRQRRWRWASAIARCSGAIRKSSRRRRRRDSMSATRAQLLRLRAAARRSGRLSLGRNGRVRLRRCDRDVLFPRSEHAPAGRARRHGGGDGRRSGRMDVRVAAGEPPDLDRLSPRAARHAIQVRVYAEDPAHKFRPSSGLLTHVEFPRRARRHWVETGTEVSPFYDPMLAKIIAHGATREDGARSVWRRAARHAHRWHRNESRLPAAIVATRCSARAADHTLSCGLRLSAAHDRSAAAGNANDGPGLSRPRRLLGHRRAALGADG